MPDRLANVFRCCLVVIGQHDATDRCLTFGIVSRRKQIDSGSTRRRSVGACVAITACVSRGCTLRATGG